jgi:UDP:flavonoid glycosyltransferase YjiC (YdhE family)
VRAVISLGGTPIGHGVRAALTRSNVSIEEYVDQWSVLEQADLFVTHHGMNSTHEAIFHRVPMLSYPFFWDQPALARKCQAFGVARPLATSPCGTFSEDDVHAALAQVTDERASMRAALQRACEWERSVIGQRDAVLDRLARLAAPSGR